jgi:hypothetical protein
MPLVTNSRRGLPFPSKMSRGPLECLRCTSSARRKRLATAREIQIKSSAERFVRLGFLKTQPGSLEVLSRVSLVRLDWLLGELPRSESLLRLPEHIVRDVEGRLADKPISRLLVVEKVVERRRV